MISERGDEKPMMTLTHLKDETRASCDIGVKISGHVRITNGSTVIEGKNKITAYLLMTLCRYMTCHQLGANHNPNYNFVGMGSYIALGTDTTTPTTNGTTGLAAPIGAPTKANTQGTNGWTSGNTHINQWDAVWNPGTVSGTVGELGLFLSIRNTLGAVQEYPNPTGYHLAARFAVADSEFTSFTIDSTKPVVINWQMKVETDGKLVAHGLTTLASFLFCTNMTTNHGGWSASWIIRNSFLTLGTNTDTGNTASMTSLVSPIGLGYGTVPNSQAISMDSPSEGSYRVTWTSTWNAGTVSGTVGEIGFRGYGCTTLITGTMITAQYAFLWRLCHADEHFQSFAIDTAKALTVSVNMVFTWS